MGAPSPRDSGCLLMPAFSEDPIPLEKETFWTGDLAPLDVMPRGFRPWQVRLERFFDITYLQFRPEKI
jgi:hypothetical protein